MKKEGTGRRRLAGTSREDAPVLCGAVIAAAGVDVPAESVGKAQVDAPTMAGRMIRSFLDAGIAPQQIVVVTGQEAAQMEHSLQDTGVVCLRGSHFAQSGVMDAVRTGIHYLQRRQRMDIRIYGGLDQNRAPVVKSRPCERIFVTGVDAPMFLPRTLLLQMEAPQDVVVPCFEGRPGYPLLLSADVLDRVMDGQGGHSLREVCEIMARQDPARVNYLRIPDAGVLRAARTREDYRQLVERQNRQVVHPEVEVGLGTRHTFFDERTYALLEGIDQTEDIRQAGEWCDVPVSRAWQMIHLCEEQWGCRIIERGRGSSCTLSTEGRELMRRYEQLCQDVETYAALRYQEIFGQEAALSEEPAG